MVSINNQEIQICLFGSLLKESAKIDNQGIKLNLDGPSPLNTVLDLLEIPSRKVQVTFVNHKAVHRDHLVNPGDRVSIFPKEYAFFVDWKDFRS